MNRPIKLENLHQLSVGSLIEQTHQLIGIGKVKKRIVKLKFMGKLMRVLLLV